MKTYWPSKNGNIDIDDMDVFHLRNVLKIIVNNNDEIKWKNGHSIKLNKTNKVSEIYNNINVFDEASEIDIY